MPTPISTTLTADFSSQEESRLFITKHIELTSSGFQRIIYATFDTPVPLRLYPNVSSSELELGVTKGEISSLGGRLEDIEGEVVEFSGEQERQLEFPPVVSRGVYVTDLNKTFDQYGSPLILGRFRLTDAGDLRATAPFYGAVIVSYTTSYRLLEYKYFVGVTAGGSYLDVGTVYAFREYNPNKPPAVASYAVPHPELGDVGDEDLQEKYRIVSKAIIQKEEPYEYPPGWTGEAGSPTYAGLDPEEPWVVEERVHEIGYEDSNGRQIKRTFHVRNYTPKQFDESYEPVKETIKKQ